MKRMVCVALLLGALIAAGCVGQAPQASYQVTFDDHLSLLVPKPTVREEILSAEDGITISHLSFENIDRTVYVLLVTSDEPRAAVILAPGAGVKKEGHQPRAEEYARAGIAMAVLDVRGNGGETAGTPLDIEGDFHLFANRSWPQYYAIVADMIATREFLASRYPGSIYAMGESNGGRYAAIAAGTDQNFSGYIGISTSGFGLAGNRYSGDMRKFLLSIDPDHAITDISPRPVLLFHAPDDSIIPYSDARALFGHAREPKEFWDLSTGHGLNGEADQVIIEHLLNFNVPERQ
ncbi:MAG: alpha/beta hydrolase [Methanomicrobiales archaeon]|nr:alpha/beta hydrolase [Methanomicrobiales archaeon]